VGTASSTSTTPAQPRRTRNRQRIAASGRGEESPAPPTVRSAARSGFNAAALRILRRRRPELTWRVVSGDESRPLGNPPAAATDYHSLQPTSR